jgi:hypothetical protein
MHFENAHIPINAAWSSPFVRWQGPAADLSSLDIAAQVTERALSEREIGDIGPSTARQRWPRGWDSTPSPAR